MKIKGCWRVDRFGTSNPTNGFYGQQESRSAPPGVLRAACEVVYGNSLQLAT
ncbi:hypothetical protein IGX29_15285 [Streptomyces sp. H28]|uniref:hypothetical protein n=1 Tax=Streptomyces sp. H28 TaxID=2775865 RepID=UPI00177AA36B|nr:hypothetical protein [Streptomyces sp. H28]MBD9733143.1 hypothetical protein [Streptomyces sp. H28]